MPGRLKLNRELLSEHGFHLYALKESIRLVNRLLVPPTHVDVLLISRLGSWLCSEVELGRLLLPLLSLKLNLKL